MKGISGFTSTDVKRDVLLFIDGRLYAAATQHIYCGSMEDAALCQPSPALYKLQSALERYLRRGAPVPGAMPLLPLQRRFEVAAQATPCARAVSCKDRWLTYGELDAQADALALHLQTTGLQPGRFCIIDLAPSIAQIRTTLAVLKAGAACMYLGPETGGLARALTSAVIRPALRFVCDGASVDEADVRTICCGEDAADLPYGWPDEQPVDSHSPASAHVLLSDDGSLQLHLRTHASLGASIEPWLGQLPSQSPQQDPNIMWRPLSRGAPYKLSS